MKKVMNEISVKYAADPLMTHLENMLLMENQITYKDFLVEKGCSNEGDNPEYNEAYIDERTHRDENGMFVVKPIAESKKFFWYVCPHCKKIHMESKRYLLTDERIITAQCIYSNGIIPKIKILAKASPLALETFNGDTPQFVLDEEYNEFTAFNSLPNMVDMDRR